MTRDLRDVVNKIIVAVSGDEPTKEEIAGLASELATFFDASVVLLYLGKMPLGVPPSEGPAGHSRYAAALGAIEENTRVTLDRMAETMVANGVSVTARVVLGEGTHVIGDIIEKEKCDLVVLPGWNGGNPKTRPRLRAERPRPGHDLPRARPEGEQMVEQIEGGPPEQIHRHPLGPVKRLVAFVEPGLRQASWLASKNRQVGCAVAIEVKEPIGPESVYSGQSTKVSSSKPVRRTSERWCARESAPRKP